MTVPVSLRPLFVANRLVGMCCEFGRQEGEEYGDPLVVGRVPG